MPVVATSKFQGIVGYDEMNFGKAVASLGRLLDPQSIADGIRWLLSLPSHVNIREIMIRPTGQSFP